MNGKSLAFVFGAFSATIMLRHKWRRKFGNFRTSLPILCSKPDSTSRVPTNVCFIVSKKGRELLARFDVKVVLCWVQPGGKLSHFYALHAKPQHVESTFIGDAFVLFFVHGTESHAMPRNCKEITQDSLICSYRTMKETNSNYMHQVCIDVHTSESLSKLGFKFHAKMNVIPLDQEYRVIVRSPSNLYYLPPSTSNWTVKYAFKCPPLPMGQFDSRCHTLYVWGDLDFDDYGPGDRSHSEGAKQLHDCKMNQIVPQVMIGNCLAGNDDSFLPSWKQFDSWVIQAQYYWQTEEGERNGSRALCGEIVNVSPGEVLETIIEYFASTGKVRACIFVKDSPKRKSEIHIEMPFCHNPALFRNWKHFFELCEQVDSNLSSPTKSGALGRPGLCVEYKADMCDIEVLRSVCPFEVEYASFPAYTGDQTKKWRTELFCPRTGECEELLIGKNSIKVCDAVLLQGEQGSFWRKT